MPRINHVKKAQQRYATVPILDEQGQQKRVPMMSTRTGEQKVSKHGRPVNIGLTQRDTDNPLPMPTCDFCQEEIEVGTPYKWIEPHGSGVRNRHEACPTWNVWEYSSSLSSRIAEIQGTNDVPDSFESVDEAQDWANEVALQIRELSEEKRESAQNLEDGFGHETEQSMELNDIADQLESWADEVEGADIPEYPEAEEADCDECEGTGKVTVKLDMGDFESDCEKCEGTGQYTPEEPAEDQIGEWIDEVKDALQNALDACPL